MGRRNFSGWGDKNKTLNYAPKSDEMVLTVHRWFANKSCPGDWLYSPSWGSGLQGNGSTGRLVFRFDRLGFIPCPQKLVGCPRARRGLSTIWITPRDALTPMRDILYSMRAGKVVYTGKQTGSGSSTGSFLVQVTATDLNIRKGPGTNYAKTGKYTGKGVFTITEVKSGTGSTAGWGNSRAALAGFPWITVSVFK